LQYLKPKPGENFIDCTIGEGGHALSILEMTGPKGKLLGIDRDKEILNRLEDKIQGSRFKKRLILVHDNFVNLKKIVKKYNFEAVSGILFDLGISSWHIKGSGRGFSFTRDEPLIMRYNITSFSRSSKKGNKLTAKEIVNKWSQKEIERILKEYAQERFAKRIAEKICKERKRKPIRTTFQLVNVIKEAVPLWYQHKKIHFATKTFQALRITVNDELNNLRKALPQALEILDPKGKLVTISFHSGEDRIVKNFFKEKAKEGKVKILTKKPQRPTEREIKLNPSSRSAKLRAAIKS